MIRLEYFDSNTKGENVFDVFAGGDYLGQMIDRARDGYRVFVGYYWRDFKTLHEAMQFWKEQAETPAQGVRAGW